MLGSFDGFSDTGKLKGETDISDTGKLKGETDF